MADETIPNPETPVPAPVATPAPAPAPVVVPAATEDSVLAAATAEPEGVAAEAPLSEEVAPEEVAPEEVAPEEVAYSDFTLPDGVTLDPEAMKSATDLFKESRLPQEQAQKFIDLAIAREQAAAHKGVQAFVDLQNKWVSEIKADPEIGGDKLTASMASAARAIDRLGVPGLKEALNLTGAGNNPAIVKAFVRLGQMVSEDRFQPGTGAAAAAARTPAETIYDGQPKQSQ